MAAPPRDNNVQSCMGASPVPDDDPTGPQHGNGIDVDTLMDELRKELSDSWSGVHDALRELHRTQDRIVKRMEAKRAHHVPVKEEKKEVSHQNYHSQAKVGYHSEAKVGHEKSGVSEAIEVKRWERRKGSLEHDIDVLLEELDENAGESDGVSQRAQTWMRHMKVDVEKFALLKMRWFLGLQEPPREGLLARFISSNLWHWLVNAMILGNGIFMVYSVDYVAAHIDSTPELPALAAGFDLGFVSFFLLELVFRLIVHRLYVFCGEDIHWNLFDSFLVLFSVYDTALEWFVHDDGAGSNLLFLRSLRILKLARTFRMIRVLRLAGPLRLMLRSVIGSVLSLFWAFVMLFFVFYMFGIAIVQVVTASLLAEEFPDISDSVRLEVLSYFGSVSDAMLVCYMATSGGNDWSVYYNVLSQSTAIGTSMFIVFIGFIQIALWNIITGIFVDNAMKLALPDRYERALDQRRADLQDWDEFHRCVEDLDIDCSGTISKDEFRTLSMDPRTHATFTVLGLDVKDAELFFELIMRSSGNNRVDFDFLIESCMKMKGPASALDIRIIMHKLQLLNERMDSMHRQPARVHSSEPGQNSAGAEGHDSVAV